MKVPAMAQSCYKELYDKRENEYLEVVKRYDKNIFETYFPQMLADLTRLLLESPKDYLGTIFMELNLGKHFNGQFSPPLIFVNLWLKLHLMRVLRKQSQKKVIAELLNRLVAPVQWYWESSNV